MQLGQPGQHHREPLELQCLVAQVVGDIAPQGLHSRKLCQCNSIIQEPSSCTQTMLRGYHPYKSLWRIQNYIRKQGMAIWDLPTGSNKVMIFANHNPQNIESGMELPTKTITLTIGDMQINEVFCDYLSSTDNQQQTTVMIFLQGRASLKV